MVYVMKRNVENMTLLDRTKSVLIIFCVIHGLSQNLETGCLREGFIDIWVSKVWYKVHSISEINHIYLQIFLF